ncbi:S24 family peptidase [uncultured Rikenella sp.]|uniref:S24 family peptidase n=1 Tax=uncultured Rikenella sp. TaxID=368003 RepID=UPI002632E6DF|nr:S24 family peptidase [uncultured Rikenella sp.]
MTEKEKLKAYLRYKGISKNRFYTETGFSVGFLDSGRSLGADKVRTVIQKFPDLSLDWLIMDQGEMIVVPRAEGVAYDLKPNVSHLAEPESPYYVPTRIYSPSAPGSAEGGRRIPLYDFEAAMGLAPVFDGSSTPTGYLSIPEMPRCDGAVKMRGDSMYPLLKAGDIVIFKQVRDCTNIIWGEMYLVSFCYDDEEYTTVKYLNRIDERPDCARLVSYNAHHAPIEVPLSAIRALAIVKASVRFNTMG